MMKHYFIWILLTLALTAQWSMAVEQKTKPAIQHGVNYQEVTNISQYYVSEKLDGIRGYWDGKQLLTRQGNVIHSPTWFTHHWPPLPIDGELWIGRGKFQSVLSCTSKDIPEENLPLSCWKNLRFMMFDLPSEQGNFAQRVTKMRSLLSRVPSSYFAMIDQVQLKDNKALDDKMNLIIKAYGEGLMLHLASAHYKVGRNSGLMKLKRHQDAEATVIGHTEGKGKYRGKLGALEVATAKGITFKIGSGFSDYQRANPPDIGTIITFKYNGLTQAGIPRFARFWRVKASQ
ncbi:DNA ligase [Colwellia piezophila]|uniref:DNA ligase n=1 Tax=Colwellia piezophila TaxID=211668 RepID=UPI001FE13504|nr:DNA ligase [Colwellia piezophila]